jgi:pyruvate dehydrogenase E1 component
VFICGFIVFGHYRGSKNIAMTTLARDIAAQPWQDKLAVLRALEQKVLWLSSWMIHNANHLRENRDGLKVGGHQASSASVATIMTALYFDVLRPQDRVAVKPHASPVFHAIQYLFGKQTRERMERFRAFGGAQSYPSRTKDADDVDFSTGSVGLGVAMTLSPLIAGLCSLKGLDRERPCRMIAWSATPSSTRATSSRRCSRAGSTTYGTCGG